MKNRRTRKLIDPRLQLNLLMIVFASAGAGIALMAGLTSLRLDHLASEMSRGGAELVRAKPDVLTWSTLHALGFAIPIVGLLAFTATFRIAGPLYRMRQFLRAVLAGDHPRPCKLRRHDELHDLCELLNEVTAEARERQAGGSPASPVHAPAPPVRPVEPVEETAA